MAFQVTVYARRLTQSISQFTTTSLASRLMVNKLKIAPVFTVVLNKYRYNKHGSTFHYAHKSCPISNYGMMQPKDNVHSKSLISITVTILFIKYYNMICSCSWLSSGHSNHDFYLIIFTTSRYRDRKHFYNPSIAIFKKIQI